MNHANSYSQISLKLLIYWNQIIFVYVNVMIFVYSVCFVRGAGCNSYIKELCSLMLLKVRFKKKKKKGQV